MPGGPSESVASSLAPVDAPGLRGRIARSPRYRWIVVAAGLVGLFSVGFSITVLAVSLEAISDDLDAPLSLVTWVLVGPLLAYALFGPSAGKLADILGARRVYLWSLSLSVVTAALTIVAWSGGALVVLRIAGAIVGAAVGPSSLAMINRLFPPDERATALGYWAMVAAGGPVIGVAIGGPVVEAFSWRWIFVGQVVLTLVALAVGRVVLPEVPRRDGVRFDVPGSLTLAGAAGALVLALNRAPVLGWGSPLVVAGFALAPVMLVVFVMVERRSPHPLLPLRYMSERNFLAPLGNQFFLNFAYMGGFFITPLLLLNVKGFGEAATGFVSLFRPLTFAVVGPLAGYFTVRAGERTFGMAGGLAIMFGLLGFATVGADTPVVMIIGTLMVWGVGMGLAAPSMTSAIANVVDEHDLGVTTAFLQMNNQIGTTLGAQLLLTTQAALAPAILSDPPTPEQLPGLADSFHAAYLVGAVGAVLGVICASFVRSSKHRRSDDELRRDELEMFDTETAPAGGQI
jgi:MFS family permease